MKKALLTLLLLSSSVMAQHMQPDTPSKDEVTAEDAQAMIDYLAKGDAGMNIYQCGSGYGFVVVWDKKKMIPALAMSKVKEQVTVTHRYVVHPDTKKFTDIHRTTWKITIPKIKGLSGDLKGIECLLDVENSPKLHFVDGQAIPQGV